MHHDRLKLCEDRIVPLWARRKRHSILGLTLPYQPNQEDQDLGDEPVPRDRDVNWIDDLPEGSELSGQEDSHEGSDSAGGFSGSELGPSGEERPKKSRSGCTIRKPTWLQDYELSLEDLFLEEEVGSPDSPAKCPEPGKEDSYTGEVPTVSARAEVTKTRAGRTSRAPAWLGEYERC